MNESRGGSFSTLYAHLERRKVRDSPVLRGRIPQSGASHERQRARHVILRPGGAEEFSSEDGASGRRMKGRGPALSF